MRLRNNPKYYIQWDGAELDAMTEEDWERYRQRRDETQRIMTPLAADFFRRWDEEEAGIDITPPSKSVIEFLRKLWGVVDWSAGKLVYGDFTWGFAGATLGSGSMRERVAEYIYDCPSLEGIPGIEPSITLSLRRHGRDGTVRLSLRASSDVEVPSESVNVGIILRRSRPEKEPFEIVETLLTIDDPTKIVDVKNVSNREEWELEVLRLEPTDQR